jgi:type IV pilus assembly protein PilZ
MTSSERRREPRAPIELRIEYKRMNAFFADYARNISHGGTFIRTDKPLPVGTEFRFLLAVPSLPEPLALVGRVQWVVASPGAAGAPAGAEPGMGIGFIFRSEAERHRVLGVVEKLMVESLGRPLYDKLVSERGSDD